MSYSVKEIYHTLQGEGFHSGRPAVFLRFAGCNLWTGREADRATAVCRFCDTDFVGTDGPGGGRFATAGDLADAVAAELLDDGSSPFVVITGGEPLLQLDAALVAALHERSFEVAVETNGTIAALPSIDWVCVSPKAGATLVQRSGDELKLVYPQAGIDPSQYVTLAFDHFFLQPMDGEDLYRNIDEAVAYCHRHGRWQVSLQTHKFLGLP